ncbi:MFS transporter [Streptomyces sp. NPDC087849]|uniref:MFS transporter n=1 Tax=Streptomyces sp. NPDC087849 TaxID=3365808 RepID=UPI0038277823
MCACTPPPAPSALAPEGCPVVPGGRARRRVPGITVVMTGVTTGCIGLLPGYATIGIWAPALLALLRFLQGIPVGGEWSGAMLLTLEHTPKEKHGSYSSIPQLGTLISSGAFALAGMLPDDSFYSWGWRLPFLAAFPLLGFVLHARLRIEESPVFHAMPADAEQNGPKPAPLIEAFRRTWGRTIVGIGAALLLMAIAACTAAGWFASGSLVRRERAARPAGDRVEAAA